MTRVHCALKDLDEHAKQRVLDWARDKFSLKGANTKGGGADVMSFESVADIFAKANHKSDPEKVLIVGAYLQGKNPTGELTGRQINKELKNLGHGVGNITNAITLLIQRRPSLMIQTRKEGKSKQAQKKYKVTTEGLTAAKKLINPASNEQT
jgi:hypothetical protein